MRNPFPWVSLFLAATFTGCAMKDSDAVGMFTTQDSLAVHASIDKWVQGTLNRDYALFGQSMTDDIILYPGSSAPVHGREAAVAFARTYAPMQTFVVDVAELTGHGDAAFDHGTYTATMRLPDGTVVNDTGSFSTIFRKQRDGSWAHHRVIFHSNLPPAPPPAAPRTTTR